MMRLCGFPALGLSLLLAMPAAADVIVLGPEMDFPCVVEGEAQGAYFIRFPAGQARLPVAAVQRIDRATPEENARLIASWQQGEDAQADGGTEPTHAQTGRVLEVGDRDFARLVLEAKQPVLVDFYATWCGPCVIQDPAVRQLAREFDGRVRFVKMDTDRNRKTQRQIRVWSFPTLVIFQDGKPVQRLRGLQGMSRLRAHLNQLTTAPPVTPPATS